MLDAPEQDPIKNDKPNGISSGVRKPVYRHPVLVVLIILITACLAILSFRAVALHVNGPSSLSATHHWDAKVRILWEWRRTDVRRVPQHGKYKGVDSTTLCIARGIVQNLDTTRVLKLEFVRLVLQDENGIDLDNTGHSFSLYVGFGQPEKLTELKPGESNEFTMQYWIPTGMLRDVRQLSAGLKYEFATQKE